MFRASGKPTTEEPTLAKKNGDDKPKKDRHYDDDDKDIQSLGVNLGQALCTTCNTWYDLTKQAQVDRHAH